MERHLDLESIQIVGVRLPGDPLRKCAQHSGQCNLSCRYLQFNISYVVGENVSMRMHMRRFTRLRNGFSRKITNEIEKSRREHHVSVTSDLPAVVRIVDVNVFNVDVVLNGPESRWW